MALVQPATLAEHLGEPTVTGQMVSAIERAEAIAASRIGCRELRSRTVTETIDVFHDFDSAMTGLFSSTALKYPRVYLSDGPAREITSMSFAVGGTNRNVLSTAVISNTGWAVRYAFPYGFGFTVEMPYQESEVQIEYVAGWHNEADLPSGIRQFVLAQATQVYATPIAGVIKVRLGDNYVDLDQSAIAKQVDQYAEMLGQWVRVRL